MPEMAMSSSFSSPLVMMWRSPSSGPVSTYRFSTVLSVFMIHAKRLSWSKPRAASFTSSLSTGSPTGTRTLAKRPGVRNLFSFFTKARICRVAVWRSSWFSAKLIVPLNSNSSRCGNGDFDLGLFPVTSTGFSLKEETGELEDAAFIDLEIAVDWMVWNDGRQEGGCSAATTNEVSDGDIEAPGNSGNGCLDIGELTIELRGTEIRFGGEDICLRLGEFALAGVKFLLGNGALFYQFFGCGKIAFGEAKTGNRLLLACFRTG